MSQSKLFWEPSLLLREFDPSNYGVRMGFEFEMCLGAVPPLAQTSPSNFDLASWRSQNPVVPSTAMDFDESGDPITDVDESSDDGDDVQYDSDYRQRLMRRAGDLLISQVGGSLGVIAGGYGSHRERGYTAWHFTGDGSISPAARGDLGLELVSPTLPYNEVPTTLARVLEWSRVHGYTNASCGLHMSISAANCAPDSFDSLLFSLIVNDRRVQEMFDRASNSYCSPSFVRLLSSYGDRISGAISRPETFRSRSRELTFLDNLCERTLSVNITKFRGPSGYLEYRSPGGDWIAKPHAVRATAHKVAIAFLAACGRIGAPELDHIYFRRVRAYVRGAPLFKTWGTSAQISGARNGAYGRNDDDASRYEVLTNGTWQRVPIMIRLSERANVRPFLFFSPNGASSVQFGLCVSSESRPVARYDRSGTFYVISATAERGPTGTVTIRSVNTDTHHEYRNALAENVPHLRDFLLGDARRAALQLARALRACGGLGGLNSYTEALRIISYIREFLLGSDASLHADNYLGIKKALRRVAFASHHDQWLRRAPQRRFRTSIGGVSAELDSVFGTTSSSDTSWMRRVADTIYQRAVGLGRPLSGGDLSNCLQHLMQDPGCDASLLHALRVRTPPVLPTFAPLETGALLSVLTSSVDPDMAHSVALALRPCLITIEIPSAASIRSQAESRLLELASRVGNPNNRRLWRMFGLQDTIKSALSGSEWLQRICQLVLGEV